MTWRVPYTDFPAQFAAQENDFIVAFLRVMREGAFILRDDVKRFEDAMAQYLGVKHVIGVNSGTDALYLAVRAAGIVAGQEVITVRHTFIATISAIRNIKAVPVLVDVGDDYCMDAGQIEAAITTRTRAILPVHLNGRMCDMERITEIAERHGLLVIEDAAQAIGAHINGRKAGAWGVAGCFSTHPMKTLGGFGDGGFVSTNNDNIADCLRSYRNHQGDPNGFNSRLDNLQAALLNVKVPHLDRAIEARRAIADTYDKAFSALPVKVPPKPNGRDHYDTFNSYVLGNGRLKDHLRADGIEAFSHLSDLVTSLPIYPEMSHTQVDAVIASVRRFYA